jgi:hypothetical protein
VHTRTGLRAAPLEKRCRGPAARGSREHRPALREVATTTAQRPASDSTRSEPCGSGPPRRGRPKHQRRSQAAAHSGVRWTWGRPFNQPCSPGRSGLPSRLPPVPPPSGPDSIPATSSGGFPKLNPFLRQLCAAPPRRQLSSPNFGAREREGSPRRAAGPPLLPDGWAWGPHSRARSAEPPARARPGTPTTPSPTRGGLSDGYGRRAGAAGGGAAKETCHSQRSRPGSPDGPARAPSPPPMQSPAKFLTCSRRRGRESKRAGAAAAAAAAAAEPKERSRPSLRREAAPEQLQISRPRRRPPRPSSAPAARWLRARVWSRGTFCLGAGERPPPPGSPPPAFPTRASHSSSLLSPLARSPPLCRSLTSQDAEGPATAAAIGQRGGSPPRPMREGGAAGELLWAGA